MEDNINTLFALTRAAAEASGNFSEESEDGVRFLDFDFRPDLSASAGLFEQKALDRSILRAVCLLEYRDNGWWDLGAQVVKRSGDDRLDLLKVPRLNFEGGTVSKLRTSRFSRSRWVKFSVLEIPNNTASISVGTHARKVQARPLVVTVWRSKDMATGKEQPPLCGHDASGQKLF